MSVIKKKQKYSEYFQTNKIRIILFLREIKRIIKRKINPSPHKLFDPRTLFEFIRLYLYFKKDAKYFFRAYKYISYANNPKYLLCTVPRSGTGYIHNVYQSVMQLKVGLSEKILFKNGFKGTVEVKKYSAELRNYVSYICERESILNEDLLFEYAYTHGHHPIQWADLVDINNPLCRPVFTIRNIIDTCKSWFFYWNLENEKWYGSDEIGVEYWVPVAKRLYDIIYYFNYWGKYVQHKKNNIHYLSLKYESMCANPLKEFRNLFNFYGIDVNDTILAKAVEENSFNKTKLKVKSDVNMQNPNNFGGITMKKKRNFNNELITLMKMTIKNKLIYDFGYNY